MLQIRLSDDEYATLDRIARSEHLKASTWARQQLLWILDERQKGGAPRASAAPD